MEEEEKQANGNYDIYSPRAEALGLSPKSYENYNYTKNIKMYIE